MNDSGLTLKQLCDAVLNSPAYKPKNGKTFCNVALDSIAMAYGCKEFDGLMADEIYQVVSSNASGKWSKADGSDASIWALSNGFAIAAMPSHRMDEVHGHVACLYPLGMQLSASLKHDVPLVANVGKTVGVMKSSQAFPIFAGEADYYIYNG